MREAVRCPAYLDPRRLLVFFVVVAALCRVSRCQQHPRRIAFDRCLVLIHCTPEFSKPRELPWDQRHDSIAPLMPSEKKRVQPQAGSACGQARKKVRQSLILTHEPAACTTMQPAKRAGTKRNTRKHRHQEIMATSNARKHRGTRYDQLREKELLDLCQGIATDGAHRVL